MCTNRINRRALSFNPLSRNSVKPVRTDRRRSQIHLVLLAPLLLASVARAGLIDLTFQNRLVASNMTAPLVGGDSISAPDFGPFDRSVAGGLHAALIGAMQDSTLEVTPDLANITLGDNVFAAFGTEGTAKSIFVLNFTLPADTPYTLIYSETSGGAAVINASYTGPRGATKIFNGEHAANVLPAGNYELDASVMVTGSPQSGTQDLTLTIGAQEAAVPLPPAVWTGTVVLALIMIGFRLIHRAR